MNNTRNNVLRVRSSGRRSGSTTRSLGDALIKNLATENGIELTERELADGVPFVDEAWINANFTDDADRTAEQRDVLAHSDELVEELQRADTIIIEAPVYNFGVPAVLKAWIDMIARARKTFRYTESGPVGMLENKKAYLVVASGGTAIDSEIDFATPYLRHALQFIGITDVETIGAAEQMVRGEDAVNEALNNIKALNRAA